MDVLLDRMSILRDKCIKYIKSINKKYYIFQGKIEN